MKLRNKKTGEIATVEGFGSAEGEIQMTYTTDNDETKLYLYCTPNLTTFNEEWEDYEEPKSYYYITSIGEIVFRGFSLKKWNDGDERRKQIGNYFETKEEAEKAVEKLKAWKRLKDKGFRFEWWKEADNRLMYNTIAFNSFVYNDEEREQLRQDLDLLFGGEE